MKTNILLSAIVSSALMAGTHLSAADGTWNVDANGLWSTSSNWLSNTIADGSGSTANFTNDITADRTVSLDGDRTLTSLVFGDSDTATAGSWILNNNAVSTNNLILAGTTPGITVNALGTGKTATISAIIEGSAGLVKSGSGTLILTGVNTYTGTATINAGTVNVTGAGQLGARTASVTLADVAGVTLDFTGISSSRIIGALSGGGANGGNIVLAGGLYYGDGASGNFTYGGIISGTGFLSYGGTAGTQTLSGNNTYDASTSITKGTLSVSSISSVNGGASNLGNATTAANGRIIIGSTTTTGTLLYTGSGHTTDRVVNLGGTTGGGTLDASGSGALVFTSAFTATGAGAKTLTLTGNNTADNRIGGAIVNNTNNTLTTAASTASTTLVLASVDGLTVGNAISGAGITAGTTISAINTGTKTVTLSAAATVANAATITSAGLVNITSLTKAGAGKWILSGTNTYTGATTISAGTLQIGAGGTSGAISSTSGITNNGTLAINRSDALTVSTIISGTGALRKDGAGTLALTGNNTYTGSTTISAGTLAITANALPLTTKLIIDGGVVNLTGSTTIASLWFGTAKQAEGTWGAAGSGASHIDNTRFSGSGLIVAGAVAAPVNPPTGFSATTYSDVRIDLSWSPTAGASAYRVERAPAVTGPFTAIATGLTVGMFSDTAISEPGVFYYRVIGTNDFGQSPASAIVSANSAAGVVDVFFVGGQSNAKSTFRDGIEAALIASGRFLNLEIVYDTHPGQYIKNWYDGGRKGFYLEDLYDPSPDAKGLLETACDKITAEGKMYRIRGFFWFQGETDRFSDWPSLYAARFNDMLSQLSSDLNRNEPVPFGISLIGCNPELLPQSEVDGVLAVREVQRTIATSSPVGSYADSDVYPRADALHVSISDLVLFGGDLANAFLANAPTMTVTGSLATLSTSYGSASSPTEFQLSATRLAAGISITAPEGFEVSESPTGGYSRNIVVGAVGSYGPATIHLRLAAGNRAGVFSGSVQLRSSGATGMSIPSGVGTILAVTPTVTSPVSSSIRTTTATLGGEVAADGGAAITARGVVYSLTATDSDPQVGASGVTNLPAIGTMGFFSVNATALTPGSAYTFKAYATNSAGTSYSAAGSFTTLRPIEGWRLSHFGDVANSGNGANAASPAGDGIPNLVKYALCLDPAQSGGLTQLEIANNRLKISFQRDPARSDITITVEGTSDLVNSPWVPVATSTDGGAFGGDGSVSETPLQGGLQQVEVSDSVDTTTEPRCRFLRIRTTLPAE